MLVGACSLFSSVAESADIDLAGPSFDGVQHLSLLSAEEAEVALKEAARKQQEIYTSIKSWRGSYTMRTVSRPYRTVLAVGHRPNEGAMDPTLERSGGNQKHENDDKSSVLENVDGVFQFTRTEIGKFIWDGDGRRLISFFEVHGPTKYTDIDTKKQYTVDSPALAVNSLLLPEAFHTLDLGDLFGELEGAARSTTLERRKTHVVYAWPIDQYDRVRTSSSTVDPSCAFEITGMRGDAFISMVAKRIAKQAAQGETSEDTERVYSQAGSHRLIVFIQSPLNVTGGRSSFRIALDPSQHYLPVACVGVDASGLRIDEHQWTYKSLSRGLLIPASFYRIRRRNGSLESERKIDFVDSQVNSPLNDEEFSFRAMGAEDGDRLYDPASRDVRIFREGHPIGLEVANLGTKDEMIFAWNLKRVVLVIVDSAVICVVVGYLLTQWLRKRKTD